MEMKSCTISWIFNQYADANGEIPVNKFGEIIDAYRSSLSRDVINKLLKLADANKDGKINRQEIARLERGEASKVAEEAGVTIEELTKFRRGIRKVGSFVLPRQQDQEKYVDKYSCLPPPIFMILITVIEFAIFAYYSALYHNWKSFPRQLIESPLIFNPAKRNEVWRFITYMFLHAGFEHIFFNSFVQLILGIPLEMVHGPFRVGIIYLAGVAAGSLGSSVFDPRTALVGASGGVYALFTAQLANVILNGDVMHKLVSFARTAFVVLILCGDFGYSIYRRFASSERDQVSFVAHVAGSIAGLTVGLVILINFKKNLRDKIAFVAASVVYFCFMLFAILWNIFYPGFP